MDPVTADQDRDLVDLVDEFGRVIGQAARATVHHSNTPRHRAFSVYLTDHAARVLLTRRALSKITWPGVWSNSCCGHPRPGESDIAAIHRRVYEELGVELVNVEAALPDFSYTATDPHGLVENESCPVYCASIVDAAVLRPDPEEVMDYQWLSWPDLVETVERAPGLLSPWAVAQVRDLTARSGTASLRLGATNGHGADVDITLAGVTRLLGEQSHELATLWSKLDDGHAPEVLAEDLPSWLDDLVRQGGKRL
jgi:isopentenyl-diphosphate delta-isomerase type 1